LAARMLVVHGGHASEHRLDARIDDQCERQGDSGWSHFKRPKWGHCKRPRRGGRYRAELARPGIYRAVFAGDAGPSVRVR
jgi:hypothetical protein